MGEVVSLCVRREESMVGGGMGWEDRWDERRDELKGDAPEGRFSSSVL